MLNIKNLKYKWGELAFGVLLLVTIVDCGSCCSADYQCPGSGLFDNDDPYDTYCCNNNECCNYFEKFGTDSVSGAITIGIGAIVGIVVGVLVCIGGCIALCVCCCQQNNNRTNPPGARGNATVLTTTTTHVPQNHVAYNPPPGAAQPQPYGQPQPYAQPQPYPAGAAAYPNQPTNMQYQQQAYSNMPQPNINNVDPPPYPVDQKGMEPSAPPPPYPS